MTREFRPSTATQQHRCPPEQLKDRTAGAGEPRAGAELPSYQLVETAWRRSEERLSLAIAAADLGIFEHDHTTNTVYWSPTLRRLFGWSEAEPVSLSAYLGLIHPEERAAMAETVQRAHDPAGDGQYRVEHRIVRRDGSIRWIKVLSRTTFAGSANARHPVITRGTTEDITERKLAEENLRESQARLQLLVESSGIGLWELNLLTSEVYFSPEWKNQLGYADDELPNRYEEWENRLHPDDRERTLAAVQDHLDGTRPVYEVEFRLRHKDGSWRWIFSRDKIIRGPDGRPVRMMGCHVDVHARKLIELELKASRDRLAFLTRQLIAAQETERRHLARELHDEIGQVLCAVNVNLQTLRTKADPSKWPRLDESIQILDTAIDQVRNLSLDLRPTILEDFGLASALRWYADRLSGRTGLHIHLTVDSHGPVLAAEVRDVCFRAAQEALTNVVRHASAQRVWVDLVQRPTEVVLTIRDDGKGFDMKAAPRRAFESGRMGLIGMQERVELLDGKMHVQSERGQGTTIQIQLPLKAALAPAPQQNARP